MCLSDPMTRFAPFCADEEAEALLNEYLDGELVPARQPALFGHLAGCAACRVQFNALLAFRLGARQESLAVPATADAALFARLDEARRGRRRLPDRRADRAPLGGALRRRVSVGAALAVATLAVVLGSVFGPAPDPAPETDRVVETSLQDGPLYVIDPGVTVEARRASAAR
jgi:anti-sigma factor RsiW